MGLCTGANAPEWLAIPFSPSRARFFLPCCLESARTAGGQSEVTVDIIMVVDLLISRNVKDFYYTLSHSRPQFSI
jgi:hypothetical protein